MKTDERKPIVCGTDFSENAAQAATVADALARRLDAPLILARSADERGEFPEHLRTRLVNGDRPRLRGVPDDGDAAKAICEAAKQFGADLVCIGTHGRSGLAAAVLGSVAQAVIAHSSSPRARRPPAGTVTIFQDQHAS